MHDTTRTSRSCTRRLGAFALAAVAAGTVLFGSPSVAHAEEVSPTGKGVVGGAFLGAEVVVFIEAIAGVRSGTAYLLGAGGGAVAGGVGGYFVEQSASDGRVPAYMLAGGLALVIPALVVTLDQTRYLPSEGAREDRPVTNLPPSDPGKPGGGAVIGAEPKPPAPAATPPSTPGATPAPAPATPPAGGGAGGTPAPQARRLAPSLLNMQGVSSFKVGLPIPEVRPVFTASQKKEFAVDSHGSELRFPVMNVTF
jgi:hypothetical protein